MQKKFALFNEVIEIFGDAGLLDEVILVGSWCMLFYKDYFSPTEFNPSIRTRDIDFLVHRPVTIRKKIDISELLKDLGFIITFNNNGYMRLEHPEIIIEFLVAELGRGTDKPIQIKELGINAQALRFLDLLYENTIEVKNDNESLKIPHPAAYSLQKLIISERRGHDVKSEKDTREALKVLDAIIKKNESHDLIRIYNEMPRKWQTKVSRVLKALERDDIRELLAR